MGLSATLVACMQNSKIEQFYGYITYWSNSTMRPWSSNITFSGLSTPEGKTSYVSFSPYHNRSQCASDAQWWESCCLWIPWWYSELCRTSYTLQDIPPNYFADKFICRIVNAEICVQSWHDIAKTMMGADLAVAFHSRLDGGKRAKKRLKTYLIHNKDFGMF